MHDLKALNAKSACEKKIRNSQGATPYNASVLRAGIRRANYNIVNLIRHLNKQHLKAYKFSHVVAQENSAQAQQKTKQ